MNGSPKLADPRRDGDTLLATISHEAILLTAINNSDATDLPPQELILD